jgi:hypothetical protein
VREEDPLHGLLDGNPVRAGARIEDAAAPATTPTYEVGGAAGAETAGLEAPEVGI